MIYIINKDKLSSLDLTESFMIFDFDRTITTYDSPTSWSAIESSQLLPNSYIQYSKELYDYYRKFEIDNNINSELKQQLMEEWTSKQLELLSMGINKELFEHLLKYSSNIKFRKGIDKFYKKMYQLNVPIIVISAGLGNVVKEAIKINNCLYDNVHIISNMVIFDNGFKIDGSVVNSVNKDNLFIPENIKKEVDNRNTAILFGDQISDLTCLENFKTEKQLMVGFLNDETSKDFDKYIQHFDIVCSEDEDYNNLSKILMKKR